MSITNKSYEFYKELPPWAKGAIIVGGGIIATLAVISILKKVKADAENKTDIKEATDASAALKALNKKGIYQTLNNVQLESICLSLVQAMDGCGTTENNVLAQFKKMKNDADVLALIEKFGIRYYQPCAASQPISYIRWMNNKKSFGGTLSTWLTYEMDSSEINTYVNKPLAANGIKFQF